ncbi:ABC transporter permease [Conexibacter sp. SYSU D00693]|uniref:MlaE family ABC transporter permease n=1 Tax=Conexibacter sp. SYSU D00693 TaxID=2812560 RepID=UPI00196B079A|nr:ABC transporter permease [Conexibacter sp. SYSU D00693]
MRTAKAVAQRNLRKPAVSPLPLLSELVSFAWALGGELRHVRPYGAEVLRQAGLIAAGSVAVIVGLAFLAGGSCGLESTALARSFGFDPIAGGFSAWCTLREVVPFVFGYILAAKVGCGFVAELGAMRVQEEVDALESMGVRSLAYLAGTRMLACAIVLPVAYALSIAGSYAAAYLMSVVRFGDVSPGTWIDKFLAFQDGWDLVFSGVKGLVIAAFVLLVSLYYGYGVRGGPVEVGTATARSMAVNIVGVTAISMVGTLVFWGANPRLPLG